MITADEISYFASGGIAPMHAGLIPRWVPQAAPFHTILVTDVPVTVGSLLV